MKHIVVLGSTNTDMVVTGQKIPVPGETVTGGRFLLNPGGKGANQAVAVARLIAKVGDDLFGSDSRARFESDGIVPRLIVDPETPSGVAVIMVDAQGQNCISVALGANGTLVPADVEPHRAEIESASALLMQLETPLETVLYAAKAAHAKGVPVILNPAPARELPAELYAQLDWITPNETEAELLTGVKVVDEASAAEAARVLKDRGVGHVIVTMGAAGCWCEGMHPSVPVKAVDTTARRARGGRRHILRVEGRRDLRDPPRRAVLRATPPRAVKIVIPPWASRRNFLCKIFHMGANRG